MTKEPLIKLPIDTPSESFKTHLEGNERILFSAPFGTGKTYFLKHFFEYPDMAEKYNVFHLFPVNYQVASNEDIFELLKYDLLYNMLLKGCIKATGEEIPKSLAIQAYIKGHIPQLLAGVLKCIPAYGVDNVGTGLENLTTFITQFSEEYQKLNKKPIEAIKSFVGTLNNKSGSIYEMDAISHLIYETLQEQKGDDDAKKNVLIIDDLDRIDPEHIFRLLNVFSAHFDLVSEDPEIDGTNKFGFDKVIFVCDVENIRNVFAAKYGQDTDFSGYIDKFYSSTIYSFDNVQEAVNILGNWVTVFGKIVNIPPYYFGLIELFGRQFLQWFFLSRSINLRQFSKLTQSNTFSFYDYNIKRHAYSILSEYNLLFVDVVYILLMIFGADNKKLRDALRQTSKMNLSMDNPNLFIRHIIPILKIDELNHDKQPIIYSNNDIGLSMEFTLGTEVSRTSDRVSAFVFAQGDIKGMDGKTRCSNSVNDVIVLMQEAVEVMSKSNLI